MSASVPPTSNNISEAIEKLRRLSRWDVQSGWKYCYSDSDLVSAINICNWPLAELNEKSHIAWPSGKQVLYLGQLFIVPDNLSGYPITGLGFLLNLTWWAQDAQLFVNGELVGQGDLFDCSVRLLLSPSAIPGDEFSVILRLVSPSHDAGALVRSICLYESANSACFDPGFVADELEILQNLLSGNLQNLNSQYVPTQNIVDARFVVKGERLKSEIELAVGLIDWSVVCDRQKFDRSLSTLRQNLLECLRDFQDVLTAEGAEGAEGEKEKIFLGIGKIDDCIAVTQFPIPNSQFPEESNLSDKAYTSIYIGESNEKSSIYQGKIYLLGHAHLDLAWLWPVEETWEVAQRTFESALKLQSEFPDLIFCHSTPALYAWIEEHRPDLFAAIKKQVAAGRWEVVGGMWVEPDLNLISAESMVRQVFYGQRYTQEKFGELMRVVWLPDTFGFGWQLPQILRDGGVEYFVTQKLRWNDTTEFPHGVFWWEGLDGTKIFSMMSGPIGENIESVKMANHLFDWQVKTGLRSAFWLPGVGDHGGGPTRDMLEVAKRWEMSPFFPNLQFAKAVDYLSLIESQFFPEISESESEDDVSIPESHPILRQEKVVRNSDEFESVNFPEISEFESQVDVSIRESHRILRQDEVIENLDEFESANFSKISESESQDDVSIPESHPILRQDKVIGNSDESESANFSKISESESQDDVSIPESHPILRQDKVVQNSDKAESANFLKISESESQVDVSIRESHPILRQDEVIGNLDKDESVNFPEMSDSESQDDVSIPESHPILGRDKVIGNSDKAESANFLKISESESQVDVSIRESHPILRQDEVIGNLDKDESVNFPEMSDSESQDDVSIPESHPILGRDKVIGNLDEFESANFQENAEFESQVDVSIPESHPILRQDKVVQNSDKAESVNFLKISEFESQVDVSIPESHPILRQDKVVQNLDAVESANFPEISEFDSQVDVSIPESHPILGRDKVIGNLDEFESANFQENAESESEDDVSIPESHPILRQDKVVQNLDAVESANFPEISEFESQVDVSIPESHPILGRDKVIGNLDEFESANFQENAESGKEKVDASTLPHLPIWKDELYLEFHRGCYTTRADQKRNNRRCEDLLYQAELLSSLATICAGAVYPKSELEIAWKQVLFNQFHDILPGSAIAKVYIDANLAFAEVDRTCRQILLQSLDAIASQISLPSPPQSDTQPILIFNTLNWSRSEVVALPIPDSNPENCQIYDSSGQRLVTQIQMCDRPKPQFTLLFSANNIPAIGYRVFWLSHKNPETLENSSPKAPESKKTELGQVTNHLTPKIALCQETHFDTPRKVLENELIRATIDGETGNLSSIWDKVNNREVLNLAGGNQLQSFQDSGQYWDAWNIDPNYQKHQLPTPILKDISWIAQGEIRQSLRVVQQIGKSEFCQDYIIEIGSPLLKIKTVVNWQEKHVLVKAAFGLNVEADFATCEIPGGAIERTTKPQTASEKAKWEVPILRWVDISNNHFGVSLLNDCKYGCDLQPNQIRLTLLRGSTWPDEQADIGIHEFTYAVYPHSGNWQDAGTVRQGYELNLPLLVQVLPKLEENQHKGLPIVGKFLDLSAKNLVLMAFKQSEDNPNLWILRCYESEGKEAVLELDSDLGLAISRQVNLLEQPVSLPSQSDDGRSFKISPWKIASFAVK